jgi:hypothetical protein
VTQALDRSRRSGPGGGLGGVDKQANTQQQRYNSSDVEGMAIKYLTVARTSHTL